MHVHGRLFLCAVWEAAMPAGITVRTVECRGMESQNSAIRKARFGRAFMAGLKETWDRLGLVVMISLTWFLVLASALSVGGWTAGGAPFAWRVGLMGTLVVLALSAPTAGAHYVAHLVFERREFT